MQFVKRMFKMYERMFSNMYKNATLYQVNIEIKNDILLVYKYAENKIMIDSDIKKVLDESFTDTYEDSFWLD